MMRRSGLKTILGGNIGNALTEEIYTLEFMVHDPSSRVDWIVAEVSSFQLEGIDTFRPKIATILNITPDHLDRYEGMEGYIDAKARIFENQRETDFLILNADDPEIIKVRDERLEVRTEKPKAVYFSRQREVDGLYFKNGIVYCNSPCLSVPTSPFPLISQDDIGIKGVHNLDNAMAASAIALLAGCSVDAIREVLMGFSGLEHRLEFVEDIKGVSFINDSKGTNVGAVLKSLESLDPPIILIAGGLDKGSDFSILRDAIRDKVRHLILIGDAKDKIRKALDGSTEISYALTLEEAVGIAILKAVPGDTVLLSPACASFDMFKDFEDRGRRFKDAVRRLRDA